MANQEQELPYRLEMWDDHDAQVEELIALLADHAAACAAFAAAVKRRPGRVIVLRQKSRVLADSRRCVSLEQERYRKRAFVLTAHRTSVACTSQYSAAANFGIRD